MEIATSKVELAQTGKAIYTFQWGESYERGSSGPYLGVVGLEFSAMIGEYRRDRYAAAEAAKEDNCYLDESDFIGWLIAKGHLTPIVTTDVEIAVRTYEEDAYVPKHWPECPECSNGRGSGEYGSTRRSLNRVVAFYRCTGCCHEWGHREVANNSNEPMLEDDGRDTEGGCVPFSISKACGIDWTTTLSVCEKHGWSRNGMVPERAIVATRELGFSLERQDWRVLGTPEGPTLKRLIAALRHDRNYIVSVKGHWLALVQGRIMDNDMNSGMGRKVLELYEVREI